MDRSYPGMDPYLEDAYHWHGFHVQMIACIREELNVQLPPAYYADAERQLVILPDNDEIIADSTVTMDSVRTGPSYGDDMVAERAEPTGIAYRPSVEETYEEYERYIEIKTIAKPRCVVTVIELLSPSNKRAGSQNWKDYRQKQHKVICSDTHLLEIDLLRFGTHTVAAPLQSLPPQDQWDYIVSLYRAPDRSHFPYWLIKLADPLPEVQVPLLEGDPDTILDLQAAYDHAFRAGRYATAIDYSQPPPAA